MGPVCSDAEIVEGCKRGDRAAQRALFEHHHRQLFRFLVAQSGDPALAEDLVQETFLKAYGAIATFRGSAKLSSWLARIGLNCFYEHYRRAGVHRRAIEPVEAGPADAGPLHWCLPRTDPGTAGVEAADQLRRALAELPDGDRAVVLLHDLLGYRYEEIASILDIATGTVGSRLHRARGRLRGLLRAADERAEDSPAVPRPTQETSTDDDETSERVRRDPTVQWSEP